ncbi:hypothetical protein HO173_009366 [Letharia columbiana]|uniref:Oxidoreductase acuF-like C2H2 type zinc-finger domain-containing protein n=1 Tax=Letharia columbiana TaxID=112416 RepID=A0A8H6FPS9_9LECA|nr:uncharacterized protein HO173_009366 [Letharia columbiana]KAF6232486.1 hypothetical protein HO173_009366 [Letharia columbiana]
MEVPLSAPEAAETLAAVGRHIYDIFTALYADDRPLEHGDSFKTSLLIESQRFSLWARNLGLYEYGHSSLDYRFRDAPSVYDYTRQLLDKLEKSLLTIQDGLDYEKLELDKGAKQPSSLLPIGQRADYSGIVPETVPAPYQNQNSDESSDEEESLLSYQNNSISAIELENARLIIDTLYKLSFKIRNPATRLGFSKARTYRQVNEDTGVDLMNAFIPFDLKHVAEIFAHHLQVSPGECENDFLVQRLARANTHRRRQFGQWWNHITKLERSNHAPAQFNPAGPDLQLNPGLSKAKGHPSLPSTATRLEETTISSASIKTTSTYVALSKEDEETDIHIPPLPKNLRAKDEFECPYCRVLCAKRLCNQSAWERHVLRDLRPYVCTYKDCTEADQQYDNIKDWVNHEIKIHRGLERQMDDPSEQSSDAHSESQDPREFLPQTQHPNPLTPNDVWREECPICQETHPSFSHVALHLRKIAVFALPKSAGSDEDSTVGDQGSKHANIDDQDSMSSQSTFESLDKDHLHEDETYSWKEWDARTPGDPAPIEKTHQDAQRFEHALQQVNKFTQKELDVNTFVARLEPDNALLYQGDDSSAVALPIVTGEQLSFYVQIHPLQPNYQAQSARHGTHNFWVPPNIRTGYTRKPCILFRWLCGTMTPISAIDPVGRSLHQTYSAATIFTHNPDTPHLLAVPFDAQKRHAYQNQGGWRPLSFHHVLNGNTQHTYSAVSTVGDHQHIAAPGSPHWMPQLLPSVYDNQAGSPRIQAGLIGSIPLLIALAAFSAPPDVLGDVLPLCLRPGTWRPHLYQYPAGHIAERGMIVTIFFDPMNPQGSNPVLLNRLENGDFGPFYN